MRWALYVSASDSSPRAGLVVGDAIYGLEAGTTVLDLLGDDGTRLGETAATAMDRPSEVVALADAVLRSPFPRPPSIRDSSSFEQHIRAGFKGLNVPFDDNWYQVPLVYFTNPGDVKGHGEDVTAAPGSEKLDYELECAAVVGRRAANLTAAEAEDIIAGYVILNDWSARDIQAAEVGFKVGPYKTKDWAMSAGPFFATKDELEPFRSGKSFDLGMRAWVNGEQYSEGNLKDIYWSFGELVAHASRGTVVNAGDLLGSGTVGTGCILEQSINFGSDKYPWLVPGDVVTLEIDAIGTLTNRVIAGAELPDWRLNDG
jgi:2-keto-4-pentenoate hydratase/2-oxohepta-3-ene-1,7-dioic acid hydratase in catechol pathway